MHSLIAVAVDLRLDLKPKPRPDALRAGFQMQPVAWSAVEKFVQQAIWLLLFFILAPILGPRPYGQFAIVMAFIGFCEVVLTGPVVHALLSMEPLERDH